MTSVAQSFGNSASLTVNATSWTQATVITTTAVDVSGIATIPDDILITVKGTVPNSALANQKAVNVYIAITEDGTNYTDNDQYSGTQNTQTTLRSPTNHLYAMTIACTINVAFVGVIPSLRAICGGILPRKFGVILENQCGQTITSPAATYTPVNFTNV